MPLPWEEQYDSSWQGKDYPARRKTTLAEDASIAAGIPLKGVQPPKVKMEQTPGATGLNVLNEAVIRPARSLQQGVYEGIAGGAHGLSNAAKGIGKLTGTTPGGAFESIEKSYQDEAQALEGQGATGLAGMLYRGAGRAIPDIAKYTLATTALGGPAGMAAVDALSESDKGFGHAALAGAKGAALGSLGHVMAPARTATRMAGMGTAMGAETAISGGSPTDIAAATLTGAGMAAPGANGTSFKNARLGEQRANIELENLRREHAQQAEAQADPVAAMGVRPIATGKATPGVSPGQLAQRAYDLAAADIDGSTFKAASPETKAKVQSIMTNKDLAAQYIAQAKSDLANVAAPSTERPVDIPIAAAKRSAAKLAPGLLMGTRPVLKTEQPVDLPWKGQLQSRYGDKTKAAQDEAYRQGYADVHPEDSTRLPWEESWQARPDTALPATPFKSAAESAAVFEQPRSAKESADVFRKELNQKPRVPETGDPFERRRDTQERMAQQLGGKPWEQLTPDEQQQVNAWIDEGYHGEVIPPQVQAPAPKPTAPTKPMFQQDQRVLGKQEQAARLKEEADAFQQGYRDVHPDDMTRLPWEESWQARPDTAKPATPLKSAEESAKVFTVEDLVPAPRPSSPSSPELPRKEVIQPSTPAGAEQAAPAPVGASTKVRTPNGTRLDVQYRISDMRDMKNSFQEGYPQEYQPRNTDRIGSRMRIEKRKKDLDPYAMGASYMAGDGAPITSDGYVITRNHGSQALKESYEQGLPTAAEYRDWLKREAGRLGVSEQERAILNDPEAMPMLHREIVNKMDPASLQRFAEEANAPSVAKMSDSELAQEIARKITPDLMKAYEPDASGNPNLEFIRAIVQDMPVEVQEGFITGKGQISQSGMARIRQAVFAKAFPNPDILETMAESTDSSIKNITNGLMAASPDIAILDNRVNAGEVHPGYDLGDSVAEAAAALKGLSESKRTVADWRAQADLFGRDPAVDQLVDIFGEFRRAPKKIAEVMREYADVVSSLGHPAQAGMFGAAELPSKSEILEAARNVVKERAENSKQKPQGQSEDLFGEKPAGGSGPVAVDDGGGVFGPPERQAGNARVSPRRLADQGGFLTIPGKQPPAPLDPADAAAQAWDAKRESARKGPLKTIRDRINQFRKDFSTGLTPILDAFDASQKAGAKIPWKDNWNNAAARSVKAREEAERFVRDQGLQDVLRAPDNYEMFNNFLIAQEVRREASAENRATGVDLNEANAIYNKYVNRPVNESGLTYGSASAKFSNYANELLKYSTDAGLVSASLAAQLRKQYGAFVPLSRVHAALEAGGAHIGSKSIASLSKQSVYQKRVGSDAAIEYPIETMLERTRAAFMQGEKNKAAALLASFEKKPGMSQFMREVPAHELAKVGMPKYSFSYLRDGKKVVVETTQEWEAALKGLDKETLGTLAKILAAPVRVMKFGTTGINLAFAAVNPFRDWGTILINSKEWKDTALNPSVFWDSTKAALLHDANWSRIEKEGAGFTSLDLFRDTMQKTAEHMRATRSGKDFAKFAFKHPITTAAGLTRALEDIAQRTEQLDRARLAMGTERANLRRGMDPENALAAGVYAANNELPAYHMSGNAIAGLKGAVLYLNARIQGIRSFASAMQDRPASTMSKIVVGLYTPVALLTIANMSTPLGRQVSNDMEEWEKEGNLYWVSPWAKKNERTGRWEGVMKFPLSPDLGTLSTPLRRLIEQQMGGKKVDALKDVARPLAGTVLPFDPTPRGAIVGLAPHVVKAPFEYLANYDTFRDKPTVSQPMQDLPVEEQYRPNTSGTVRKVAGVLNASPVKVEQFVKNVVGGVTPQLLNTADWVASKAGLIKEDQVGGETLPTAVAKRFTSAAGGAQENSYYSLRREAQEKMSRYYIGLLKSTPGFDRFDQKEQQRAIKDAAGRARSFIQQMEGRGAIRDADPVVKVKTMQRFLQEMPQ